MFRDVIVKTPFVSDAANLYFKDITGESYASDNSFLSTLRALIAPRIGSGEKLTLQFKNSTYSGSAIRSVDADRAVRAMCPYGFSVPGVLTIHSISQDYDANIAVIEQGIQTFAPGYHKLDKITAFYRKSFGVVCYVNTDIKSTIIFVQNLDARKVHYLQVSILAFLPWYLNPDKGVSEEEMLLMQSLRETDPDKYMKCITAMASKYDFRAMAIREQLANFESAGYTKELEKIQNEIRSIEQNVVELNTQIGTLLGQKDEAIIRSLGLEKKISESSGEPEIMEYFLCNKRLVFESFSRGKLSFAVRDYIDYFDRDMAERAIKNKRSFVYTAGSSRHSEKELGRMEALMREIFVSETPRLRVRVCAAYTIKVGGNVEPVQGKAFNDVEFESCLPNPHINHYGCMGNYTVIINDRLSEGDYIGALEQCIASCKSLNWADSAVMNRFMSGMWDRTNAVRCIELPDGTLKTPSEAACWLEKEDTVSAKEEETENEQTN